jgi:hypothetical protein
MKTSKSRPSMIAIVAIQVRRQLRHMFRQASLIILNLNSRIIHVSVPADDAGVSAVRDVSIRVTPQRCAHFFLEETGVLRVEWEAVQTAKTGPTLVFSNPISSMVPIIGGFFIGGPVGTPFRSVRNLWMIGSGPIFL